MAATATTIRLEAGDDSDCIPTPSVPPLHYTQNLTLTLPLLFTAEGHPAPNKIPCVNIQFPRSNFLSVIPPTLVTTPTHLPHPLRTHYFLHIQPLSTLIEELQTLVRSLIINGASPPRTHQSHDSLLASRTRVVHAPTYPSQY